MIYRILKLLLLFFGATLLAGAITYFALTFYIKLEDTVIVPELVGKDVVYVLQTLTDLGLNTKVKGAEYSAEIPANHVIFQKPSAGQEIKRDRDVHIIISKGARSLLMPNLKGLSMPQARIILEENALCSGEQTLSYSSVTPRNEIIAHHPPAGSRIDRGQCVDLLVSMGLPPKAYKMPDLRGRSLDEALLVLEESGFKMGEITSVFRKGKPRNIIIDHDPMPGHRVLQGMRIRLSVNRRSSLAQRASVGSVGGVGLFRYRLDEGFLKRRVRVLLNGYGGSTDLFDGFLDPGEEIWHLVPKHNNAMVLLYVDGELVKTEIF
ncbi:MAG: PASTA domain-containing protein [Deltaproteobacteria bacterium]|nr:PASTA domain-containing protein [Deltaproteobacteria bacterium]